jgi:hypothetical protein
MTESTIAGDYASMCVVVPCILSEGTVTVTSRAYSSRGLYEQVATFASELRKGDPVAYAYGETIEYETTGGLTAVTRISTATGRQFRGRIVSEPRWVGSPPTSTKKNLEDCISGSYYRIADVELWGVTNILAVKHTTNNSGDLQIGRPGYMAISAASSYSAHKVCIEDTGTVAPCHVHGGDLIALTYRVTTAAGTEYTALIGAPSGIAIPVNT